MRSSSNNIQLQEVRPKTKGSGPSFKTRSFLPIVCLLVLALSFCLGMSRRLPAASSVYIKQLKNGHYQLMVNRKAYVIRGACYSPIPIGQNHEYDWWSDSSKPWLADGKLMRAMGINTVRVYQPGPDPGSVKKVIADLYQLYGIRTIMGHWLGFWEYPCPFYGDPGFRERVKKEVLEMVRNYKDEPGVLFWVLGNENNYSCLNLVRPWSNPEIDKEPDPQKQKVMRAEIYYSFVNELAREIHKIDPSHPVALGNGELIGLDVASRVCPDIDLVGCIIYRGKTFGNLFKSLRQTFDKPLAIIEFGADSYNAYLKQEDQHMQAFFLESQWRQIYDNLANQESGAGNCLGGTIFEWTDEWWKHAEADSSRWKAHDTESFWSNGSYYYDIKAEKNMNMNEEWFGIVTLSEETDAIGLNKRLPKKAYYVLREFWKNPHKEYKLKGKKPKWGYIKE